MQNQNRNITDNKLRIQDLESSAIPIGPLQLHNNYTISEASQKWINNVQIAKFVIGEPVGYTQTENLPIQFPPFRPKATNIAVGPWTPNPKHTKQQGSPYTNRTMGRVENDKASRYTTAQERQKIIEEYLRQKQWKMREYKMEEKEGDRNKSEANASEDPNINHISGYAKNTNSRIVSNIRSMTEASQGVPGFKDQIISNKSVGTYNNIGIGQYNNNSDISNLISLQKPTGQLIENLPMLRRPINVSEHQNITNGELVSWQQFQLTNQHVNMWRFKCAQLQQQIRMLNIHNMGNTHNNQVNLEKQQTGRREDLNAVLAENNGLRQRVEKMEQKQDQYVLNFRQLIDRISANTFQSCSLLIAHHKTETK